MSSERAEALHADLVERVNEFRSSTEWLEAIIAAARFHEYSFGNWLLLWSQADRREMSITRLAGFRTWQQLGRQVRRGERGFQILAPIVRRTQEEAEAEVDRRVVTGFRVATVFDLSQTDGHPLPMVRPQRLAGDDPTPLFRVAVGMIRAAGFGFELARLEGPNGSTSRRSRTVLIDQRLEPAQRTKTTVHELAHVLMHADNSDLECRGRVEVEAESVAFVVCAAAGLETSNYSVPYIATWSQSTNDPARTLLVTAEAIVRTARLVLAALNETTALPLETSRSLLSQWTGVLIAI